MYSPQKSAEIAGVSRKTVMDAINAKKLNATRNNRNHWVISKDDLKAWMDTRGVKLKPDTSSDASSDNITRLSVENSGLKAEVKAKDETITDLKVERDDWKALAQRSVWQKLFGK
jgi:excisionase family DNA binding protein